MLHFPLFFAVDLEEHKMLTCAIISGSKKCAFTAENEVKTTANVQRLCHSCNCVVSSAYEIVENSDKILFKKKDFFASKSKELQIKYCTRGKKGLATNEAKALGIQPCMVFI